MRTLDAARRVATGVLKRYARNAMSNQLKKRLLTYKRSKTGKMSLTRSGTWSPGKYAGKVKGKRIGRKLNPYLSYGFMNTVETNGTISDADCVYVGHSAMSGVSTLQLICQVLLRKLFKIGAKWHCTNMDAAIPGYTASGSDAWRVRLVRENKVTGAVSNFDYDLGVSESISSMVGDEAGGAPGTFPALFNTIRDYCTFQNGADQNVAVPVRLELYRKEANVTAFWQFAGDLVLEQEMVHLKFVSSMKFQNRTLAANDSPDAENVANNPLSGRVYEFDSGAPRARVDGVRFVETVNDWTGVLLARGAQFSGALVMKEPPPPKIFYNCVKSKSIKIDPGDIKASYVRYETKQPLMRFLERMGLGTSATAFQGGRAQVKLPGKCAVVALEDMINVNAAQLINVAYEVNRVEMCYLSTMSPRPALGKLYQRTQNNNP